MNWAMIWVNLFGTASFLGIDMGFWVGMAVVLLIVVLMNVVFWSIKPQKPDQIQFLAGSRRMLLQAERLQNRCD